MEAVRLFLDSNALKGALLGGFISLITVNGFKDPLVELSALVKNPRLAIARGAISAGIALAGQYASESELMPSALKGYNFQLAFATVLVAYKLAPTKTILESAETGLIDSLLGSILT